MQPRLVKWNIPFLDIVQTVLKAGFCPTLHSSLLSTAAKSRHPWSHGIIPHQGCCKSPPNTTALSSFWTSAGLTRPLRCGVRSGSTEDHRLPGQTLPMQRWMEPTVRHPNSREERALVLIATLHVSIIKSWQPQITSTGHILFLINQSPGSEGAEKLFKWGEMEKKEIRVSFSLKNFQLLTLLTVAY